MRNKKLKLAGNAAQDAGNAHMIAEGRPIFPWSREALDKAHYTFHNECRLHHLTPYEVRK